MKEQGGFMGGYFNAFWEPWHLSKTWYVPDTQFILRAVAVKLENHPDTVS
jgi:hypothetical protein